MAAETRTLILPRATSLVRDCSTEVVGIRMHEALDSCGQGASRCREYESCGRRSCDRLPRFRTSMEEWQRRQVDEWHRRGYLPKLGDLAKSFAAPFWWYDRTRPIGSSIKHNGTMVFVDTGTKIVGVTADHVYRGYLRDVAENPNLICQIGAFTFQPETRLIDADHTLDLATFELSEIFVVGSRSNVFRRSAWPASPLIEGELALLGGFPGAMRSERPAACDFDFSWFVTRADSSSPRHASIVLNLAEAHGPGSTRLPLGTDLGGASGGPVFRLNDGAITPLELVGFIYEYGPGMELVFASHASSVGSDGTLHRL